MRTNCARYFRMLNFLHTSKYLIRMCIHKWRRVFIDEYTMLFALIRYCLVNWTYILRDKESCTPIILYNFMYKDKIIIKKDNLYSLYRRIVYLDKYLIDKKDSIGTEWNMVTFAVYVSLGVTLQRRELVTTLSKRGYIDHSGYRAWWWAWLPATPVRAGNTDTRKYKMSRVKYFFLLIKIDINNDRRDKYQLMSRQKQDRATSRLNHARSVRLLIKI